MKQKSYCLHGLSQRIINYILEFPQGSLVFFDDGLASLYRYSHFLQTYRKVKFIIAINPWIVLRADDWVAQGKEINLDYIPCTDAHNLAKNNNFSHYLTTDMIKDLHFNYGCEIADHSWNHFLFEKRIKGLKEKVNYYKELVKKSKDFYTHINIYPTKYVRPYNKENQLYEIFVKKILEIKDIYGEERIDGPWNVYKEIK